MCGITGFYSWKECKEEASQATLQAMTDVLRHRGPDDAGVFLDGGGRLGLGHRRLSIVDLSPAGHQPMASANGRFVIIFNGEIYNYEEIRARLVASGSPVAWRGHSDTEVAIEAIARWGLRRAVAQFNGMFAIAVWDRQECRLQLTRDRSGVKPLCFGFSAGIFIFGSEIRALTAHPSFDCRLNYEALGTFLAYGYFPNPDTVYRNALYIAPGSILEVECAAPGFDWEKMRAIVPTGRGLPFDFAAEGWRYFTYWSAHEVWVRGDRQPFNGTFNDAKKVGEELLKDSIRLRLVADVPVGVFLSGGIDSSIVAVMMQQQSRRPIKTFTIGFIEDEFDESRYAVKIAERIGTEHTNFILHEQECLDVTRNFTDIQDEPLADSSFIPTYLVSKLARQYVTVALTGDGGDETFWGYWRYRDYKRLGWLYALPSGARVAFQRLATRLRTAPASRGQYKWYLYRIGKLIEICGGQDFFKAYYQTQIAYGFETVLRGPVRDAIAVKAKTQAILMPDLATRMTYADTVGYLPDDLHMKVDRASMQVSLEAREPLLDYRLVEFAASLPPAMKISRTHGKLLLREILYRYVPPTIIDRPKQGFSIPMERWLRGALRPWAEEILFQSKPATEGLFDRAAIRSLWNAHQAGEANHKDILWNVIILRNWLNHHRWT
ncbi:MAG: asparagine synthase (glutamine-hydrolyzing) [Opitutaceae bacterium]|nr:asparagine synthase (glutamine-hydrolyzing) [Opitutaceae bacterium]